MAATPPKWVWPHHPVEGGRGPAPLGGMAPPARKTRHKKGPSCEGPGPSDLFDLMVIPLFRDPLDVRQSSSVENETATNVLDLTPLVPTMGVDDNLDGATDDDFGTQHNKLSFQNWNKSN